MGILRGVAVVALVCAAVAPAAALTEDEERAKAHFLAGQSYYDQASYADALKEFNEAYRISKRPALLYNIARCNEGLGDLDKAVASLQDYLAQAPNADDREAVQQRIKNLQDRLASRMPKHPPVERGERGEPKPAPPQPTPPPTTATAAPPPTTATSAPAASKPARKRVWTWVVGGIGLGLLAGALGTGISAQLDYGDLNNHCMMNACSTSYAGEASTGKQLALATDVLWPIGAAAMVTAIVLFVVEGRHPSPATRAHLAPSGGSLALAF
jgi:tetratricopeptide (TPR) repeat protein